MTAAQGEDRGHAVRRKSRCDPVASVTLGGPNCAFLLLSFFFFYRYSGADHAGFLQLSGGFYRWPKPRSTGICSPIAKPDADPAAARSDKLYAALFKRLPDRRERSLARLNRLALDHVECNHGQAGFGSERSLRPLQKPPRGANLGGGYHESHHIPNLKKNKVLVDAPRRLRHMSNPGPEQLRYPLNQAEAASA
jgi:hypothetical protein